MEYLHHQYKTSNEDMLQEFSYVMAIREWQKDIN